MSKFTFRLLIKFWIGFVIGMLWCECACGQQVYVTSNRFEADYVLFITDNKYEADNLIYITDNRFEAGWPCEEVGNTLCGRWFMTDNKYRANIMVYFTNNRYQADRRIYYTTNKYQAFFEL